MHVSTYSFDTDNPFNGKRSQKIELPLANTWAGISQDGFYKSAVFEKAQWKGSTLETTLPSVETYSVVVVQ